MTPLDPLALIPAAFLAGLLMFLAPCTLPIVPGYLAFIAGAGASRKRVVVNAVAFVAGFSIVFIVLGTFASVIGGVLGPWREAISRVAGIIIIVFGLTMLGILRVPVLSQEKRFHIPHLLTLGRPESSFLIGALFALGWSPCIGPILGTILLFASTTATATQGAFLLGVFSLGLGVPFIITALLLDAANAAFSHWARAASILSMIGGAVLMLLGFLMLSGLMGQFVAIGLQLFDWPYRALLQYM